MRKTKTVLPGLLYLLGAVGCGGGSEGGEDGDAQQLPTAAPTKVDMVTSEGFQQAGAVAASPDGKTFYVAAYDEQNQPAIFSVEASTGFVRPLAAGNPLLYPSDLSVSCDGERLFVSDMGIGGETTELGDLVDEEQMPEVGAIHAVSTSDGTISELTATGVERAAGIIVSVDCSTLYVTGWTEAGMPAVFTVPTAGGAAKVLFEGAPLASPTGVHVDANDIAWVMDHVARGDAGEGVLFAITPAGEISEVASGLPMGRHGGVSLVPGGVTAVIPVADAHGSKLITANTETGETAILDVPEILRPTGVAAAREAPVMVVAGEDSIHIASFEE